MSGPSLVVDTNIILYLLNGDQTLSELLEEKLVYVSFITELELLSYSDLKKKEREKIQDFLNSIIVIDINPAIKANVISIRSDYRIKLPDSIIAATAQYLQLPLFTADKQLGQIKSLSVALYER